MGDNAPHLQPLLSTLRVDPPSCGRARLQRIDALAARTATLEPGPVRAVLEDRLRCLIEAVPQQQAGPARPTRALPGHGLLALAGLLAELRARRASLAAPPAPAGRTEPAAPKRSEDGHGFTPLPALDAARQAWARLRLDAQLRDVLAEIPDDAGPMHSTVLVHRAIAVMLESAPGYLRHFLGHADALATLERHCPAAAAAPARQRTRGRRRPG